MCSEYFFYLNVIRSSYGMPFSDQLSMDATDPKTSYITMKNFFEFTCSEYLRAMLLITFECVDTIHEAITYNNFTNGNERVRNSIIHVIDKAKGKKSLTPVKLKVLCKIFRLGVVSESVISTPSGGWENTRRVRDDDISTGDDILRIIYLYKEIIKANEDDEELPFEQLKEALETFREIGERFCQHSNQSITEVGKKMQEDLRNIYLMTVKGMLPFEKAFD